MSSGLPPILQGSQLPSTFSSSSNTVLPPVNLPLSQLEGLRLKASQIVESTQHLLYTLQGGLHPGYMPAWPEILSKYNVILSQTHNFSNALLNPYPTTGAGTIGGSTGAGQNKEQENIFQKIVLHPNIGMPDSTLDMEIAPLLRNQQVMDVLKQENETVRRLSEHMNTRGMMGVLGITSEGPAVPPTTQQQQVNGYGGGKFGAAPAAKPEYDDVLKECAEIRDAHDRRVERAVRAVHMLRERYDWKQRVEAAQEEEEMASSWNRDAAGGGGGGYDDKGKESESDDDDDDDDDEEDVPDEEEHREDEDQVMGNSEQVDDAGGDMDEEIEIDNMFVDLEVAPSTPAPVPETPKQEPNPSQPPPINPPSSSSNPPAAPVVPAAVDDDEPQIIRSNIPEIIDLT